MIDELLEQKYIVFADTTEVINFGEFKNIADLVKNNNARDILNCARRIKSLDGNLCDTYVVPNVREELQRFIDLAKKSSQYYENIKIFSKTKKSLRLPINGFSNQFKYNKDISKAIRILNRAIKHANNVFGANYDGPICKHDLFEGIVEDLCKKYPDRRGQGKGEAQMISIGGTLLSQGYKVAIVSGDNRVPLLMADFSNHLLRNGVQFEQTVWGYYNSKVNFYAEITPNTIGRHIISDIRDKRALLIKEYETRYGIKNTTEKFQEQNFIASK